MGADRTLVEGAYRAAMAKVPGDYSKFYWQEAMANVSALKSFVKTGTDYMKHVYQLNEETKAREALRKKADDNQWNKFEKIIDAAGIKFASYERGGDQESLHKKIYDLYLDSTNDWKERYRLVNTTGEYDTPENKKERQAILGEMNAGINELKKFGGEVLTLTALNKGKHLSKEGMGGAKPMYLIGEITNQDGDWSNVDVERTKEEGLVFVVDGSGYIDPLTGKPAENEDGTPWGKTRVSAKNFMKNIIPKATGQQQYYLDATTEDEKQVLILAGKGEESKFDFFGNKESITKNMFTDEKAFVDLMHRPWIDMEGGGMSVRDIWMENPELQTATYGSLGVALAQQVGNKDNFITEADFVLPGDRQKIADALFRPTLADGTPNPNFSWEAGTDVGSDILAQVRQKRHDDLVSENPIDVDDDDKTTYRNKTISYQQAYVPEQGAKPKTLEIQSDEIINIQNQMASIEKSAKEHKNKDKNPLTSPRSWTVRVSDQWYMYFQNKGWARVQKVGGTFKTLGAWKGEKDKQPEEGWLRTMADVLKDVNLPTTYLQYTTASTGKPQLPGWNK